MYGCAGVQVEPQWVKGETENVVSKLTKKKKSLDIE
jgi:hypothetical protein